MPQIVILPHAKLCPEGAVIETEAGKSVCDVLLENDIHIEHARGPVAEQLHAVADRRSAGLLAVGSRGRGSLAGTVLGSVSRSTVRLADRPVMIVSPRAASTRHSANRSSR